MMISCCLSAQETVRVYGFQVSGLSFDNFCKRIEGESGVKVYYRPEWVTGLTVTLDADSITVLEAVQRCLQGTGLSASAWNGQVVVLKGEGLPGALPVYNRPGGGKDAGSAGTPGVTQSEERYLRGRSPGILQTIRIGKTGGASRQQWARIRGRITEEETGEDVVGATMFLKETRSGAATDQNGILSLVVRPGTYEATFAFMGLETRKFMLEVISDGDFTITLRKAAIQMEEVVVLGDRQMNIRYKDPGLEKISVKTIREIPMMLGERDILKVSEMMPGIVTIGEVSAGLNVRGGNYDQNAFYINRIPVYNTSHLFGFFPAFNADIIKDFSIYKGYIPARYGGQLSSVFNIIGRQGNRRHFTAHASVSPVAASLSVEGPLKKDTSSFLVSARYLFSDWILGQIDDPVISTSSAGFNDMSAAWNYDFRKSQLSVFLYHSQDRFKLSDLNEYDYSTNGASAVYTRFFSSSVRADLSLAGSLYAFRTIDWQEPTRAYKYGFSIGDYRINADVTQDLNPKNSLQYGAGITFYRIDRGSVEPEGSQSLRVPVVLGLDQGVESALYLSDDIDLLPWLNLNAGVRFTLFSPVGPRTEYNYLPGAPMDPRYISDTVNYGSMQPIKWYFEPDLRANVNIRTDADGTVKVAFNHVHQNLFVLSNTIALSPNAQWKLADLHIPPARSTQISAGIFRTFPKSGWDASAEAYYKRTTNYPEFLDGADFLGNPQVEQAVIPGKQDSYGIELMLRRSGRRLEGWLAYTFSRSFVKVDGEHPWEKINNGNVYPANYDIPNALNTVLNYHIGRRFTASGVFTYQTGRPVTYPVSMYYIGGTPYVDYSARNDYRIPDYIRLDLSLTIEGNLKKSKLAHYSLIFSLYNVTGRDNPYSVYFTLEDGRINSYQYSVISVPFFMTTLLLKLGNYASD